jgi:antibiotic biosynthesis monooxygenase (ABM) superfamily enzyme
MKTRLIVALCLYGVFAISAWFTLDGKFRLFVWILMGGFAIRTISGYYAMKLQDEEGERSGADSDDESR